MMHHLTTTVCAAILLGTLGCDDGYDRTASDSGDIVEIETISSGITIRRPDEETIYYLAGNLKNPSFKTIFESNADEKVAWFKPGPDILNPKQVFVMTTPADPKNTAQKERLKRVTTDGKAPTVYKVGSLFDRIELGLGGQLAVLYHSGQMSEQMGFFNPNEVALINLTQKPGKTNPQALAPPLEGQKIDRVSFVPSIRIGGEERQLLVFLAGSVVSVHDLADPARIWARGPLVESDAGNITPRQILPMDEEPGCADKSCEARIFIRADGTRDIYTMSLGTTPIGFDGAEMNQLEAGGSPMDMAVVRDREVTLLSVLSIDDRNPYPRVNFIDLKTGAPFSIDILDRVTRAVHLKGEVLNKLVLFGNGTAGVHFLSIDDVVEERGKNLDEFKVAGGIQQVVELEGNRLLLVPYPRSSTNDLIILDTVTEQEEMVSSSGVYDWTEAQIHGDIFYLVPDTKERVDMLDLATGHPSALYLDDITNSLHILKGTQTAIAYHNTPTGRVTLFPLKDPSREKAKILDGLWLIGCLEERGEEI